MKIKREEKHFLVRVRYERIYTKLDMYLQRKHGIDVKEFAENLLRSTGTSEDVGPNRCNN